MLAADQLLDTVYMALDDIARVHTSVAGTPSIDSGLRALSRAQQLVALRYTLVRRVYPWPFLAGKPLYRRQDLFPRALTLLSAELQGLPLWSTPLKVLRYRDPHWLVTQDTPALFYRVRWSYVGLYPVPAQSGTALMTTVVAPLQLVSRVQRLEVPDSFGDHVSQVATGLLLMGYERLMAEGLKRVKAGLGLVEPQERTA